MQGLKGLPTKRLKKRRKKLRGLGPLDDRLPALPDTEVKPVRNLEDPDVLYILSLLKSNTTADVRLARRCVKLKQTELPYATTPELITYIWLQDNGYDFAFQVPINGGRKRPGGQVVDFIVNAGRVLAWPIDGVYWHSRGDISQRDNAGRALLVGQWTRFGQIAAVVPIWESQIYREREYAYMMALAGIELGK